MARLAAQRACLGAAAGRGADLLPRDPHLVHRSHGIADAPNDKQPAFKQKVELPI